MRSDRPIRRALPALSLLASAVMFSSAASANELQRLYELARKNDATLAAAQHARDAAIEARPQALAELLPRVSASASQTWQRSSSDSVELIDPDQPELGVREISTRSSSEPYSLAISATQPLFDWGALKRYAQAGDRVALAELSLRAQQQDLRLRVSEAYFDVLAADDARRSFEAQRLAFERGLEEARRRLEVGVAALTDVQEAQASRDLAAAQELEASQTLDAATQALAEITGEPVGGWARLRENIALPAPTENVDHWIRAARENNLDLAMAAANVDIAAANVDIARANHLPTLGLSAARSLRDDRSTDNGRSDGGSVALQFSLPLFAGGAIASQVREATANREQAASQELGTLRFVERTTRDAYQGVQTGSARVEAYRQAVRSSRTALEASQSGMRVGTRRMLDVLNAQQQLSAAERDYERARYDYLLNLLRLKAAAGQLDAGDLDGVDALLADS